MRKHLSVLACRMLIEPTNSIAWAQLWHSLFHTTLKPLDYALVTVLVGLISMWVKSRLEESIKHVYAEKLEDYKRELNRREQAARVAELLALVKTGTGTNEDIIKANQLSWEMSLWLPTSTAKRLGRVLAKASGAPAYTELLIEIRCILLGLAHADLTDEDIASF